MKTSSAKAKGRRCAKEAKEVMLRYAKHIPLEAELTEEDLVVASSGQTGEDLLMSPAARLIFPWNIECKNVERLDLRKSWQQATSHGSYMPLLVHTRNRDELLCTLRFEDLVALICRKG